MIKIKLQNLEEPVLVQKLSPIMVEGYMVNKCLFLCWLESGHVRCVDIILDLAFVLAWCQYPDPSKQFAYPAWFGICLTCMFDCDTSQIFGFNLTQLLLMKSPCPNIIKILWDSQNNYACVRYWKYLITKGHTQAYCNGYTKGYAYDWFTNGNRHQRAQVMLGQ